MGGALGLSESEIWETTPRTLVWMYQGLTENQESIIRNIWEAARFQALVTANSQGAKIKDPKKLIKFEWEETQSTGKLEKSDIERLNKKFNKNGLIKFKY